MRIDRAKQIILIAVGLFSLLVIVLGFGIIRSYTGWQDVKREIVVVDEQIIVLQERLQRLTILKEQGVKLEEQLLALQDLLPTDYHEKDILIIVRGAALGPVGGVAEIRFDDAIKKTNYNEIPFKLVYEGQYQGFLDFINNLGQSSKLFRIDDCSIEAARDKASHVRVNMSLVSFNRV